MALDLRFRIGPFVYSERVFDGSARRASSPPVERGPVLPLRPASRRSSRLILFGLLLVPALAGLFHLFGPGR